MQPSGFADGRPTFDPLKLYNGHPRSCGVFENTRGEPTGRLTTVDTVPAGKDFLS